MANKVEAVEEYISSLRDLWYNNKPMIKMLTSLAAANVEYAGDIFDAIQIRLQEVPMNVKLPILYLMDAIIKNVGGTYTSLFCKNIVAILHQVYYEVDQQTRKQIVKLRQTWNNVLPPNKLKLLDASISYCDSTWPCSSHHYPTVIPTTSKLPEPNTSSVNSTVLVLKRRILEIQKELLHIQQRKLELDSYEAQIKLQQEYLCQNAKTAFRTPDNLQTNRNNEKWEINPNRAIAENPRHVRDPRLFRRQQQPTQNSGMVPEPGIKNNFSERITINMDTQKDFSSCDCSATIIAKSKVLVSRGNKRFSEDVELSVSKKANTELWNRNDGSADELYSERLPTPPSQIIYSAAKIFQSDVKTENKASTSLFSLESLRRRQPSIIGALHGGQQCSHCGERFLPQQIVKYREHLDWHFRQNRKVKQNKVSLRSWYYSNSSWKKYYDGLEGKTTNYFEKQKQVCQKKDESVYIPCVKADANVHSSQCVVCNDKFEEFYDEDEDEWQLRMAIRVEGKIYHPNCYQITVAGGSLKGQVRKSRTHPGTRMLNVIDYY